MAGPTRTKVYHGEPWQQQAAFEADRAEAARHGWLPLAHEQSPGSLLVTYARSDVSEGPVAAGPRRTHEPGVWKWLSIGASVGVLALAVWAQSVSKPAPLASSGPPVPSSSPTGPGPSA